MRDDEHWMQEAIKLAKKAELEGEVPVGAVLVLDDKIIGTGWNKPIKNHDPSAHAEIQALRDAGKQRGNYRLPGTILYVTLEPCTMCAGAIIHARIERLVFGAYDCKTGVVESVDHILDQPYHNHKVLHEGGVLEKDCSQQLTSFFKARRSG
ncbi:MAG: tRNA adenosine(34) deaminase TadA [Gammaproteobacteria bacterium]|nr:tRNA adenosine(34) deaminase TadA [Gammaproteobacteria bacterium]